MNTRHLFGLTFFIFAFIACVSTGKFNKMQSSAQARYDSLYGVFSKLKDDFNSCSNENADLKNLRDSLQGQIKSLNNQVAFLKENNNQALKQLQTMSVISSAQAESIKKSLDNIGAKDVYIQSLQEAIARKDSLNVALVLNLKGAIGNLDDKDINIKVDKGVIYIDISDKMLFKSGSYDVTTRAQEVLGKVAMVLKNQPNTEFMVEGHTDNIPYKRGVLLDNWDLSVKRATAVVRILQNKYGLPPEHITAAGRSEYVNVASNDTNDGRAANRRTRIVILPQLDQFFQLLERK